MLRRRLRRGRVGPWSGRSAGHSWARWRALWRGTVRLVCSPPMST